ncbi:MAG: MaoC family dehydratase, partial [Gammaproteobacteria bacterium]|nr:MaoC family dehydratase [Gammaproteobacteria bacterium]
MSENTIIAFMDDPDEIKPNPIHSTSVAKDYGFDGALVGGATAYGWTVRTIVDALGVEWLDHGWVELRFKRPIYPGDALEVRVDDDGNLSVKNGDVLCF